MSKVAISSGLWIEEAWMVLLTDGLGGKVYVSYAEIPPLIDELNKRLGDKVRMKDLLEKENAEDYRDDPGGN